MMSVLDFLGVEKQLKRLPGVHAATVNIATNTGLVEYDENVTDVEVLRAKIVDCGFYCCGEVQPKHLCETPTGEQREIGQNANQIKSR